MPKKKPQPDDEGDLDPEDPCEEIIDNGEVVFSHDWDSGGLGAGAGCETVYRWKGRYVASSEGNEPSGPYDTLEEALKQFDLLTVTSATTSINCPLLSAKKLAAMLSCYEDGHVIEINGQPWVYHESKGFRRKRTRE
jgi:hypothetical protein